MSRSDLLIIGAGEPQDKLSIPLATRCGNPIKNEKRKERAPDALKAAKEIWLNKFPNIKPRSLTQAYNCVGMVFGSRRTCIDPQYIKQILQEDEYHQVKIEQVQIGDIVLYKLGGEYVHIGIILSKNPNIQKGMFDITILSQWGADGEYIHKLTEVPEQFGKAEEFWTDRRSVS